MGWTGYHASCYKNGKVDRKAECDYLNRDYLSADGQYQFTLLKSALIGSVYYAAIQRTSVYDMTDRNVYAVVYLTSTKGKEYCNFYYKDMSEDMCPFEYKCPESILKLLTPTTSVMANEWRRRCKEYISMKKSPNNLSNLPIGTKIKCKFGSNDVVLVKHSPTYQFKTWFWFNENTGCYVKKKDIPSEYEVVKTQR